MRKGVLTPRWLTRAHLAVATRNARGRALGQGQARGRAAAGCRVRTAESKPGAEEEEVERPEPRCLPRMLSEMAHASVVAACRARDWRCGARSPPAPRFCMHIPAVVRGTKFPVRSRPACLSLARDPLSVPPDGIPAPSVCRVSKRSCQVLASWRRRLQLRSCADRPRSLADLDSRTCLDEPEDSVSVRCG